MLDPKYLSVCSYIQEKGEGRGELFKITLARSPKNHAR